MLLIVIIVVLPYHSVGSADTEIQIPSAENPSAFSVFSPSRSSSVAILDQFQLLFGVDAETVAKSDEG